MSPASNKLARSTVITDLNNKNFGQKLSERTNFRKKNGAKETEKLLYFTVLPKLTF